MKNCQIIKKDGLLFLQGRLGQTSVNLEKYDKNGSVAIKKIHQEQTGNLFTSGSLTKKLRLILKPKMMNKKNIPLSGLESNNLKTPFLELENFLNFTESQKTNIGQLNCQRENQIQFHSSPVITYGQSLSKSPLNTLLVHKFQGIYRGFFTYLRIVGIGYRVFLNQNDGSLTFKLGFSHLYKVKIPNDVKVFLPEPTLLCFYGLDKNQVTQIAAKIRQLKKPSPYKGKGIRILNSAIKLKQTKKK